jgi:hypothetical protein
MVPLLQAMPAWFDKTKNWFNDLLKEPQDSGKGPEALLKADYGLPSNGHVLAFGHFSSERNLDAFVLDESRNRVHIYLWNRSTVPTIYIRVTF